MNVTVADCLRLPSLSESMLIAGEKGLERTVSSVSVLECSETRFLSNELFIGSELIISAMVIIKDDVQQQCRLLRHLHSMGASGVILFYVGVFIPRIDEALIDVANEIALPLISMPFGRMDFRYSDIITDVVEFIHNRRLRDNFYATDVINSIALIEPQKRNVAVVLRLLSDNMRCTLLLTDRYLEHSGVAAWPASNKLNYSELLQTLKKRKTLARKEITIEQDGHKFRLWDVPIKSSVHHGMHLLVLDEFENVKPEMLQQATDVVTMFLNIWEQGRYYEGTDALVDAIMTDDPARMRKIARKMAISIESVNTMWVLKLTSADVTTSQKLDVILKLKTYLHDYHKVVIVDTYGSYIIALTDRRLLDESIKDFGEKFISLLKDFGYSARGCIFEDMENTSQTRDAYIRMDRCFAELCLVYPYRNLYLDSDVRYVQSCLDLVRLGEAMVEGCLLPIKKLQRTTDGDILIETLCTYLLDAESSAQYTGTLLHLHKNTVHYRLNKIRSVLRCDLVQMPATLAVYEAVVVYRILNRA